MSVTSRALVAAGLFASVAWSVVPASAYEVFVTNERDNTVSVIDSKSYQVTRTFDVGRRPRGLIFSKDGKRLFVCASDSDAVQAIEPDSGKLLYNLPSGEDPEQFALAPDGKTLFIANENNAVTTSETTNMVHWIDVKTLQSNDATPVGQRPREAVFSKDGALLWVSSEVGGTVAVIDVADHKVVHTISFDIPGVNKDKIQPVGIRLTSDGRTAFVALGPADHVAVVDAKTYEVKSTILVGRRVWHLALTPEEDQLFTTNGVSGDVTVIDVAKLRATRSIKVGRFPWGVAVRPDGAVAKP